MFTIVLIVLLIVILKQVKIILLDEDMTTHVGDFGLAKIMNVKASRQCLGETGSSWN